MRRDLNRRKRADIFRVEGKHIRLPRIGWVRIREEQRFSGTPKRATVAREAGRWFASIMVEIPDPPPVAQPSEAIGVDLRKVLNAIRYMTRTGGGWRMLPKDFPPWQTVCWWFRRFVRLMLFRTIHDLALMIDRERAGRNAGPSAGVITARQSRRRLPGHSGATMGQRRQSGASDMWRWIPTGAF